MKIKGVEITTNLTDMTVQEATNYVDYVLCQVQEDADLVGLEIIECADGKVDVNYHFAGQKFERIRRITGYLTGDVTSWNDAKRAEETERVKHV